MEGPAYTGDIHTPTIGRIRAPRTNQQNANALCALDLSGEHTLRWVLDQHYDHHTGDWLIHRDTVIQLIPFGGMQFFGFPGWKTPSLPEVRDWLGDRAFAPVDRMACDLEAFFGEDGRRWMNAYKQQARRLSRQKLQWRCVPKGLIVSAACTIHRGCNRQIEPVA